MDCTTLNQLSNGDVALKLFEIRKELYAAQSARATAATKMYEIEKTLEKARETFNSAVSDERYLENELKTLERYLENRLSVD